ncbi:helix-turn-helix domain-containing protein [Nocardia aurea]|uniref:helix-turn-helix domain-containing protein n=1 Tax=Nocardia aurea TaxID=2144174 RepID=UPI001300BC28|nr:helix-turn-helix domain-containing protein [Nocardia aurea]
MLSNTHVEDLGSLLRSYRRRARLSQQALADLSAVSVRAIRDLESGRVKHPRRETVRLLANGLRVEGSRRAALEAATGLPEDAGELKALDSARRIPVPTGELVGRIAERELLRELVGSGERLTAVAGLGGIGKTRLVMEVANELHGIEQVVLWVSDVIAEDLLTAEIALADAIGQQATVLVLDGYDVLGGHADAVYALLHRCRRLRVLVTTRRPHHFQGWRLLPLAPLQVPVEAENAAPEHSEAGRLLVRHLRHAHPGFTLDAANATVIADICRQVDGIPAALEVVAQWSLVHRLDELRDELLGDPAALSAWPVRTGGGQGPAEVIPQAISWLDPAGRKVLAGAAHIGTAWSVKDISVALHLPVSDVAKQVHTLLMLGLVRRKETSGGVRFEILRSARRFLQAG